MEDIKNLTHQITLLCVKLNKHHNKNMDLIEALFFGSSDLGLYVNNEVHGKQICKTEAEQKQRMNETIDTIIFTLQQLVKQLYVELHEVENILNKLIKLKDIYN